MNRTAFALAAALCATSLSTSADAARPCPPDINCSGQVNIDDLLGVISAWGASGGSADVNASGTVDIDDLLLVIGGWGDCVFDYGTQYPNAEAHQIGLEMLGASGPLTLSPALYDRIDRDLGLIRAAYPALVGQGHSLAWAPNQMLVGLVAGQPQTELACLNTYYQATQSPPTSFVIITTPAKVNVPALCAIYDDAPEVSYAEPNGFIGGQNFWEPTDQGGGVWRWNIDDGFHDCFDGCDCHRFYVIDVDAAGVVTLISYQEVGASWCKF